MFYRAYVGIILAYSLLTTGKFSGASWNQTSPLRGSEEGGFSCFWRSVTSDTANSGNSCSIDSVLLVALAYRSGTIRFQIP